MADESRLNVTHWLANPDLHESLSKQISIPKQDYFSAIQEILDVFPIVWIEEEFAKIIGARHSLGEFSLYPLPDHRLSYHPVPVLLSSRAPKVMHQICELIKLGKDLYITKDLPRIQPLRRDLRHFSQYLGRLFELEVLAACMNAGIPAEILKTSENSPTPDFRLQAKAEEWIFVEVTHKQVPCGMAIASRLVPGMAFKEFGALQVRINPGAGADNQTDEQLASTIIQDADDILARTTRAVVKKPQYEIRYDPGEEASTLRVIFGKEVKYDDDLGRIAFLTLQSKEEYGQLRIPARKGCSCVIGMDFRTWSYAAPAEPKDDHLKDYYKRLEDRRRAIVRGCQSFLAKSSIVAGVLGCWRRAETAMAFNDLILNRFVLSLMTIDSEVCLTPTNFQQSLSSLSQPHSK